MISSSVLKRADDCMAEYYALVSDTAKTPSESERKNCADKLFAAVYELALSSESYKKHRTKCFAENDYDLLPAGQFISIFKYCCSSWRPGGRAFSAFFLWKLENEVRDALKKIRKRAKNEESMTVLTGDGDETDRTENISDGSSFEERLDHSYMFDLFNNSIKAVSMKYENSPKICYPVFFYTEFVTKSLYERDNDLLPSRIPPMTFDVISTDFAETYLTGKADSVSDILNSRLKKLSEFTGCADDKKPCGYDLANIVYISYIEKTRGKKVSASNISQQRNSFRELMVKIMEDAKEE